MGSAITLNATASVMAAPLTAERTGRCGVSGRLPTASERQAIQNRQIAAMTEEAMIARITRTERSFKVGKLLGHDPARAGVGQQRAVPHRQ
jgi:hypothetical protein